MAIGISSIDLNSRVDTLPASQAATSRSAQSTQTTVQPQRQDSVQLSAAAQQALAGSSSSSASTKVATQTTQPSLDDIIRQAADGNLSAIVRLALV